MKILKKIAKGILYFLAILLLLLALFGIYVYNVSDAKPPEIKDQSVAQLSRTEPDSNLYQFKQSWLRKNQHGLYEMYLEGNGFERGVAFGKLGKELVQFQEQAFTNEIHRMIPSKKYLKFLKYVVGFMNRDLSDYVINEYQDEIYGVSLSASEEYNWIGTNYSRQLNYHAAHDIGHALANMMLVGCSSFATWDAKSKDSQLIVGRNFDFYVGDEFAKNKIIAFYNPSEGNKFMSVTWGGFTGVVSGMNMKGLTVTINANKSSIPFGAATPVSLVAREILQYASNIQEAIVIARKRKMFVSESFLVSSATDNKAVVIEKTPTDLDVYESKQNFIQCTNHYQGDQLAPQGLNQEQMKTSASVYRYERLKELLDETNQNTPERTAAILRDYKGLRNTDIGLTNEKAMNQFLAHHSIIFAPKKLLVWVSTSPWQEGAYICYDLQKVFSTKTSSIHGDIDESSLMIQADTFMNSIQFQQLKEYLSFENDLKYKRPINAAEIVRINPTYYDSYRIAGDEYQRESKLDSAALMYKKALHLEIATEGEREAILKKLERLNRE